MHMADALISPAVGGTMWAAAAGLAAYSAKKVQAELDESKVPLMGVLGAFIFAAQMINFTIPGTGSSGHLGGAVILTVLLGRYAAFLTMLSILVIQALFFGDGGLLALGCNIMNLGFFTCFIAYPWVYKKIVKDGHFTTRRMFWGSLLTAVIGLQLAAFGVVFETMVSGRSELPFHLFVLLMQPIHLAIGIVEGFITTAVLLFVRNARPETMRHSGVASLNGKGSLKKLLMGLALATLFTGGVLSWFASTHPDGLEWSMFHVSGQAELESKEPLHESLAKIQEQTAILPDYAFKTPEKKADSPTPWPDVNGGTSAAGLVGALLTLVMAGLIGFGLNLLKKRWAEKNEFHSKR